MKRIHSISLTLILLLILCGQHTGRPQQKEAETFTFSVQSQFVEVYLTVAKGKQLIAHLEKSDFSLLEDGMPVAVDRLDNQEVPLQIVLLMDLSESIRPSLGTIREAAIAFLDSLKPKDRVTLILFNSEIRAFEQKADDRSAIIKEIMQARAQGMTRLYDSLIQGIRCLEGKSGRKAIVCFTDGQDTSGKSSGNAVIHAAARFGYPIYMIGAGAGLELDSLKLLLRQFAEVNSGRAFFIQNLNKLRSVFTEVSEELRAAYVLYYYTNVARDGRWHNLSVIAADPSYTLRFRKGFFARREQETNPKP